MIALAVRAPHAGFRTEHPPPVRPKALSSTGCNSRHKCTASYSHLSAERITHRLDLHDGSVGTVLARRQVDASDDRGGVWHAGSGADSVIPLPSVTGKTLGKVIEYCKYHAAAQKTTGTGANEQPSRTEDEAKSFDSDFMKVDHGTLYDLMQVRLRDDRLCYRC